MSRDTCRRLQAVVLGKAFVWSDPTQDVLIRLFD